MIKVLYIGEDQYWAGILTEALKDLAEVLTAPSPNEVVGGQADLIVLDALQIDQLGGLIQKGYLQRVVVTTSAPRWKGAQFVFREGALDYIEKTINIPDLRREFEDEILPIL